MRREGYATELLSKLCAAADQAGAWLQVEIGEETDTMLDRDQLAAWFCQHGFKHVRGAEFEREPNLSHAA